MNSTHAQSNIPHANLNADASENEVIIQPLKQFTTSGVGNSCLLESILGGVDDDGVVSYPKVHEMKNDLLFQVGEFAKNKLALIHDGKLVDILKIELICTLHIAMDLWELAVSRRLLRGSFPVNLGNTMASLDLKAVHSEGGGGAKFSLDKTSLGDLEQILKFTSTHMDILENEMLSIAFAYFLSQILEINIIVMSSDKKAQVFPKDNCLSYLAIYYENRHFMKMKIHESLIPTHNMWLEEKVDLPTKLTKDVIKILRLNPERFCELFDGEYFGIYGDDDPCKSINTEARVKMVGRISSNLSDLKLNQYIKSFSPMGMFSQDSGVKKSNADLITPVVKNAFCGWQGVDALRKYGYAHFKMITTTESGESKTLILMISLSENTLMVLSDEINDRHHILTADMRNKICQIKEIGTGNLDPMCKKIAMCICPDCKKIAYLSYEQVLNFDPKNPPAQSKESIAPTEASVSARFSLIHGTSTTFDEFKNLSAFSPQRLAAMGIQPIKAFTVIQDYMRQKGEAAGNLFFIIYPSNRDLVSTHPSGVSLVVPVIFGAEISIVSVNAKWTGNDEITFTSTDNADPGYIFQSKAASCDILPLARKVAEEVEKTLHRFHPSFITRDKNNKLLCGLHFSVPLIDVTRFQATLKNHKVIPPVLKEVLDFSNWDIVTATQNYKEAAEVTSTSFIDTIHSFKNDPHLIIHVSQRIAMSNMKKTSAIKFSDFTSRKNKVPFAEIISQTAKLPHCFVSIENNNEVHCKAMELHCTLNKAQTGMRR